MDSTTEEPTIAKILSELPRLKIFDEQLTKHEEIHTPKQTVKIVDKNTYLGVEVEIENVKRWDRISPYWEMIEDGSLRNNGREFITPPIKAWRLESALGTLFNTELNPTAEFSERTSIHVHMNIRTLTVKQLEALVITYLVFEKVLYNWVGHNRYQNVFCTPICETILGTSLKTLILTKSPILLRWQKYTGLNLIPIKEKGTIEFRHLHGTKDIQEILTWVNLLLSLKIFALKNPPEYIWEKISSLNTTSQYRMFGEEVFKEYIHELYTDNFNTNVANCISYIKRSCLENPFLSNMSIHTLSPLGLKVFPKKKELASINIPTINQAAIDYDSFFETVRNETPLRNPWVLNELNETTPRVPPTLNELLQGTTTRRAIPRERNT